MLHRSKPPAFEVAMFSLISLYFASRRDVVLAERHMAGLVAKPAAAAPAVAVTAQPVVAAPLALAA
jgi:hypothetical protein